MGGASSEYWRVAMVVPDDEIDPVAMGIAAKPDNTAVRYFDSLKLYVHDFSSFVRPLSVAVPCLSGVRGVRVCARATFISCTGTHAYTRT